MRFVLGDTAVVENLAPVHGSPGRLEVVTRYGALNDPGPTTLVNVMAVTTGPDGSVYVYDNEEGIKRFDRGGEFSGWVAREGAGPGEVRYTTSLAVGPNGEVAALDLGNRRVMIIQPTGHSKGIRMPDGHPRYHEDALQYEENGVLRVGINPVFTPEGTEPTPRLAYLGFTPDGAVAGSLFVPGRIWDRCPIRAERRHRVGYWDDEREPFIAKAVWALGPDGSLAIGCPDRYEFDLQGPDGPDGPDGSVLRVRWSRAERVPLEPEYREYLAKWAGLTGLPDERPAYARLIVAGDGRVWVWPNQPAETWTPSRDLQARTGATVGWRLSTRGAFEVFDEHGRWLGTVPVPNEFAYSGFPTERPVMIRGDTLWAITRDSLEVNYVTRFLLRWD